MDGLRTEECMYEIPPSCLHNTQHTKATTGMGRREMGWRININFKSSSSKQPGSQDKHTWPLLGLRINERRSSLSSPHPPQPPSIYRIQSARGRRLLPAPLQTRSPNLTLPSPTTSHITSHTEAPCGGGCPRRLASSWPRRCTQACSLRSR